MDPPWSYNRKSTGGTNKSGSSQQYNTMTLEQINDLYDYIHPLINQNSVMFLWTTNSFLQGALDIMWDWGFDYKTMITWVKRNNGLGNWFRGKTEHLLMGVRSGGKVKPFRLQIPNLIISEKTLKHSEKPEESYVLIEQCAKNMVVEQDIKIDILELFARQERTALEKNFYENVRWTCIGKDISGNDIKEDLKNCLKENC